MKYIGLGLMLTAGLLACGGDDDDDVSSSSGGAAGGLLAKSVESPADATCPLGGTMLQLGLDKNQNGALDPDEVQTTQTACKNPSAPTLTSVAPSGASDKCKNGGTTVRSGADKNGNGKLDPEEVETTEEICTGGSSATLAVTSTLEPGDDHCPSGGTKTEAGLDNGVGTSGNGVLDPAEITTTAYACAGGFGAIVRPPADPARPASTYRAGGGTGSVGVGGDGGQFLVQSSRGGTSNVLLFDTGHADASYVPRVVVPQFGAEKLDVTVNTEVSNYTGDVPHAIGEYYTLSGGPIVRQVTASTTAVVTGIHVAPGATLTVPGAITLSQDLHLEGILTTPLIGGSHGSLQINVAQFRSEPGARIRLDGAPVAGSAGGSGGSLQITAGVISNAASIDAFGAAGDAGGSYAGGAGGSVYFGSDSSRVESSGAIDLHGGAGKAGGGYGGTVYIQAKSVACSGSIEQSGGGGGGGGGAQGGTLVMVANAGSVLLSGAHTQNGGDADPANCVTCSGGAGGQTQLVALGGNVVRDGATSAHGGKGIGNAGGAGGTLMSFVQANSESATQAYLPAGSLRFSGAQDRRGGDGTTGGAGGSTSLAGYDSISGGDIVLYGYDRIETTGGNGVAAGGVGGDMVLTDVNGPKPELTGTIAAYAELAARGGSASAGAGRNGGQISLTAGSSGTPLHGGASLLLRAALDTTGGNGTTTAGMAGPITLFAVDHLDLAALTANGGNATVGTGAGTPPIEIRTNSSLNARGAVIARGGNGTGGGSCNSVVIASTMLSVGDVTCSGGNGGSGAGGNGGALELRSTQAPSTYGVLSAAAGTGTPHGVKGAVVIDGMTQP